MELTLMATARAKLGKEQAVKLRKQGNLPGVLYGESKETTHILVNESELDRLLLKGAKGKLIKLTLQNGNEQEKLEVILKELQKHPFNGSLIHVDFLRVAKDHLVTVKIPVHIINEEKRLRDHSIIEILLHELEISCLPGQIPERFTVDVGDLTQGSAIHVKDLSVPKGVRILNALDETIVLAGGLTKESEVNPEAAETLELTAVANGK